MIPPIDSIIRVNAPGLGLHEAVVRELRGSSADPKVRVEVCMKTKDGPWGPEVALVRTFEVRAADITGYRQG